MIRGALGFTAWLVLQTSFVTMSHSQPTAADWPKILLSWNGESIVDSTAVVEGENVDFYVFIEEAEGGSMLFAATAIFDWSCYFELLDFQPVIANPVQVRPALPCQTTCMDTFLIEYDYCPVMSYLTLVAHGTLRVPQLPDYKDSPVYCINIVEYPSWMPSVALDVGAVCNAEILIDTSEHNSLIIKVMPATPTDRKSWGAIKAEYMERE